MCEHLALRPDMDDLNLLQSEMEQLPSLICRCSLQIVGTNAMSNLFPAGVGALDGYSSSGFLH
jgi:hypothetical protein